MKKTKLIENKKAILYKFYSEEEDYYYIVTRLNFNKAGKRKSMRFKTYEEAKQRFLQINYM